MDHSTIFTELEENNCFSVITQVIIKATAFFILFVFSSETLKNRAAQLLKLVLQYYNHLARGDYSKI